MTKPKAKDYRISSESMLAIRLAVVDLMARTPGGQRRRNLTRQLTTLTQALRGRGYLVG